jgi:hypothetical protein
MPQRTDGAPGLWLCRKVGLFFGRDSENLSRPFFLIVSSFLNYLICACLFLVLSGSASIEAAPQGFLEGHLKIISPKEVELAGETPSKMTARNYGDYPLIIRSQDGKKEIARFIADPEGNYYVPLPPGDYILDVQGRRPGGVRAKPQPFKVVSNQTVRVDMNIDTGIR